MTRRSLALVILLLGFCAPALWAQDSAVPAARAREDGTYANLFTFEFLPGKTDEGLRVLRGHLLPAWRSAGVEVTLIESLVGGRDVHLIVPLLEGPVWFESEIPEQDARAWAALVERLGAEEAERTVDRFVGFLSSQTQDFVFLPDVSAR